MEIYIFKDVKPEDYDLLKLAFETLKLRRVIADCNTLNTGSYRIMEKIGMRREAHFVKMYQGNSVLDHRWCDKYQYAVLREEWEKAKQVCSKVKEFLQKYGIYEDIVNLLKQGSKAVAQKLCEKKLPSDVCTSIILVVGKILSKINVC